MEDIEDMFKDDAALETRRPTKRGVKRNATASA
jgi:threonylcarbamoyladenosine tRNA methylthiotransferase CDKAL1